MIGAMVGLGLMVGAMTLSSEEGEDMYDPWEVYLKKREVERRYEQSLKEELEEARQLVLESDDPKAEAERTGFIFTIKNKYIGGLYVSVAYGLHDSYNLFIGTEREIGDYEIEVLTNAFWYIMAERWGVFSVSTFEEAIRVGGYAVESSPVLVSDISYHRRTEIDTLNIYLK